MAVYLHNVFTRIRVRSAHQHCQHLVNPFTRLRVADVPVHQPVRLHFAGLFAMQLVTGALMHWNQPFADDWRTGATFVHDWVYLALVVLTIGHVHRAVREPALLQAMTTGTVTRSWAERERPGWSSSVPDASRSRTNSPSGHPIGH